MSSEVAINIARNEAELRVARTSAEEWRENVCSKNQVQRSGEKKFV